MKDHKLLKGLLVATVALYPLTASAATKKETVFTTLSNEGTVLSSTVTNHICALTKEQYEDDTRLSEIVSLNSSDTFTQEGTKITWKASGNDIYYQGKASEESPLDITIKYYLNGKELKAKDMVGQKGNVKIKINLKNKMKNKVKVNGKYETLYTPFVVLAGTIIKSENNSNISATNGRVINTGDKNIVASIASPGLYKSLSMNKLSSLDDIEFSFYTKEFKMDNIYIIATPKLIDEKDTKLFKDLNKVTDSIKTLQDSINKIEKGSNELKDGTSELLKGSELISSKLPSEEDNKTNEQKLTYLKGTNESTITKLKGANTALTQQLTEVNNKISATETKLTGVTSQVTSAKDAYDTNHASLVQLRAGHEAGALTEAQEAQLATLETVVPLLENQYKALKGTKEAIEGTLTLLKSTKSSLGTSIQANKDLMQLIGGNNEVVKSSINTIGSMRTLSGAMNQLNSGIKKLNSGATTLSNGITQFNTQGIKKLSAYSNKVQNYSSKAEALVNLSKNYKGYASDNSSETIFVNKVESVK